MGAGNKLEASMLMIHQMDRPHAASCQTFRRITADASDAENDHLRPLQLFHSFFPYQKRGNLIFRNMIM